MKRRLLAVAGALLVMGTLSSCSLVPSVPGSFHDDSEQVAAVQMRHIADAVKNHDAAALKKLFSPRAREKAADLDSGLKYFLSLFPSGKMTWETQGTGLTGHVGNLKQVTELSGNYRVLADGKKWNLHFAYISVNDYDRKDVGIYALGAVPPSENGYTPSGARKPFPLWAGQFVVSETTHTATGDPGVYIPQK